MKWTTKDNITKDIRELETSHLENILKMLKRNNGKEYVTGGIGADGIPYGNVEYVDNDEAIEKIELELRLRKLEQIINNIKK